MNKNKKDEWLSQHTADTSLRKRVSKLVPDWRPPLPTVVSDLRPFAPLLYIHVPIAALIVAPFTVPYTTGHWAAFNWIYFLLMVFGAGSMGVGMYQYGDIDDRRKTDKQQIAGLLSHIAGPVAILLYTLFFSSIYYPSSLPDYQVKRANPALTTVAQSARTVHEGGHTFQLGQLIENAKLSARHCPAIMTRNKAGEPRCGTENKDHGVRLPFGEDGLRVSFEETSERDLLRFEATDAIGWPGSPGSTLERDEFQAIASSLKESGVDFDSTRYIHEKDIGYISFQHDHSTTQKQQPIQTHLHSNGRTLDLTVSPNFLNDYRVEHERQQGEGGVVVTVHSEVDRAGPTSWTRRTEQRWIEQESPVFERMVRTDSTIRVKLRTIPKSFTVSRTAEQTLRFSTE